MEIGGPALVDYYDAFHLYLCAIRLRSMSHHGPQLAGDHKDAKLEKLYEMLIISLIGMTNSLYFLGELRWGYESLNLLVYLCQNLLKPGEELALYIRDMLIHYDSNHNQMVFQLNEFERILMSNNTNSYLADQFKTRIVLEEDSAGDPKINPKEFKFQTKLTGLHDLIQKYKYSKVQLEDSIRDWYIEKIRTQKEAYFQAMRSKDSKLSQSYDEEKFFLFSNSTNLSGKQNQLSPTRSPTRKTSKRTLDMTAVSMQGSLQGSIINETSIDRAPPSTLRPPLSKSKESITSKKTKPYERLRPEASSLNNLNDFLVNQDSKMKDPLLRPREHIEKKVARSILSTVFPKKKELPITDYFRNKILNELHVDFKSSKGLEGSVEKNQNQESQDWKFREKLQRAKKLSQYNKTQFLLKKVQQELDKKEQDPLNFDPQNVKRDFKTESAINDTVTLVKDIFIKKHPEALIVEKDSVGPPSPRNLLGFEDKDKKVFSKLEQVMRNHPNIFSINKLIAFKETVSAGHPFYQEEQLKLEELIKKEAGKSIGARKLGAELVSSVYPELDKDS
jgi:hypothetical protein